MAKELEKNELMDNEPEESEEIVVHEEEESGNGKEKYYQATGRRKESVARVRLYTKKSTDAASKDEEQALVTINEKDYTQYFTDKNLQHVVESPLRKLKSLNRFKATVMVHGGGPSGQAGAVKHGIARALELFDANFRKKLKKSGFLTRDPRVKERRKYGLKKARKSPQWSKR
ncbi:MAG TPA: 30S ribosomal protein S9 [Candidatus Paceibacterota bacterium]|nr:30S ribosomal protein S9 [Candidatus Paceibacterota bacterium]